jgi:hypothetical protein
MPKHWEPVHRINTHAVFLGLALRIHMLCPRRQTSCRRNKRRPAMIVYSFVAPATTLYTNISRENGQANYCGAVNTKPRILGGLIGRSGIQLSEPALPIAKIADALDTAPKNRANGCGPENLTLTLLGLLRFHVGSICCAKCCLPFGCKSHQGRFYNFQSNNGQPSGTDHDPAGV